LSANAPHKLLGRSRSLGARASIYQGPDALEIEVNEQYEVVEKRVLYDDVMMVTIHRELGAAYLVLTAMFALFFIGIGFLIASINIDAWPVAAVFGAIGFPALLAFLTRLFLGTDVVTVFGRRSKTNIRFGLKKKRAREVYGLICAAVRSAHRRAEKSSPQSDDFAERPQPVPDEGDDQRE
jgi:uncharacterized integral membrane protein